jgi:hypothetical protein
MGIMLGLTGQSWKTIMKREREKELLFRGSQIKEAIENWYDPNYSVQGVKWNAAHPLVKLEDLLKNPYTLTPLRYLPQSYENELDDKNQKCGKDCPKLKINQDPMTGKEWELIKCDISTTTNPYCTSSPNPNKIIGVASKSEEEPLRTKKSFIDTALENMGTAGVGTPTSAVPAIPPVFGGGDVTPSKNSGGEMKKYSEWKFIADKTNDHKKIYKAYHEGQ